MRQQQSPKGLSYAALYAARAMLNLGRTFMKIAVDAVDMDDDEFDRKNREMDARELELTLREASLDLRRALWNTVQGRMQARGNSGWPDALDPINTPEGRRALAERLFVEEMRMRNMDPSAFTLNMRAEIKQPGTVTGRMSSQTGKIYGPWWQQVEIVERSAIDRLGGLVDA